ncbi:MAG: S9 family peptidase [Candidatus Eremiobacteraeota bacterium]|nr:S9 family peptidase [Candidatus Eremiobacteraeota bacterium]
MKKGAFIFLLIAALFLPGAPAQGADREYTFRDFIGTQWVKDPQVSPSGDRIVFVLEKKNLSENTVTSRLMVLDIKSRSITGLTAGKGKDSHPRWSPDGAKIAFTSTFEGDTQVWVIASSGGEAKKITALAAGASDAEWSPDGKTLLLVSDRYQGCKTERENKKRVLQEEKSKVKAKIFTDLPYQVFDHWRDNRNSHLFTIPAGGGEALDLTPGAFDIPPIDLGGTQDYCFSPDSKEICYVTNTDKNLAWSTNNDLFIIPAKGGAPQRITAGKGCDCNPRYSPDGTSIAYTSMIRPGFEADRRIVMLYDRKKGTHEALSDSLDRTIDDLQWAPDSSAIYCSAEDEGYKSIYRIERASKEIRKLTGKSFNTSPKVSPDGSTLYFLSERMTSPPELQSFDTTTGVMEKLTDFNRNFASLAMNPAEEFSFKSSDGLSIHGFLVKPPHFDPQKKYPLVYLIHGGPQGAWSDDFHPRWNTELFAASGYVVAAVNFRGSVGYGQKFTDMVSKDWGGKPYQDLMEGLEYLITAFPFINKERMSCIGASYGGYMVNWMMGHTDCFRAAICHSGVFNTLSEYGTTEELWFPEWEFKGTPYDNRELYEKWNPLNYVDNFKTPCLVVHGAQDFRVPVSEGQQLFTALRRNGVPAKFLYFPDECHFVRKPQNLELWYRTMLEWLATWLKGQ